MILEKLVRPVAQLLAAVFVGGLSPGFDSGPNLSPATGLRVGTATTVELVPVGDPAILPNGYHFPVTSVPEPPSDVVGDAPGLSRVHGPIVRRSTAALSRNCPLELRAVVVNAEGGFAIVVPEGARDSEVVSIGARISTRRGRARVLAVANEKIVIELDGRTVHCILGRQSSAAVSDAGIPPL